MSCGSSASVTPPVRRVASSSAGISVIHAVSSPAKIVVTSSGRSLRSSTHSRAARSASVSASRSWNSSTSTPRSRIRSTNASCSWRARRVQMTSSNSSSWQLVGERRSCARSGRCTITLRSVPTSEATPRSVVVEGVATVISFSRVQLRTAAPPTKTHTTTKAASDERPHELQVAVVADLGEGEAAHDHRGGRRDQVHEAGRRLVGGDGHRARDVREVRQRREDRHHQRGVPGRRRHQEGDRHVDDQRDHAEHALRGARDRVLHPVQDGVGHVRVLHDHGDPAREHDDQRGAEEVGRAGDDRVDRALLAELGDQADRRPP